LMGKRPTKSRPASRTQLERKLRQLDREILGLMSRRAELSLEGADRSADDQAAAWPPSQDTDSIVGRNEGPLSNTAVRAVFRELTSGCRSLTMPQTVAYLGPAFSYSHLAAIERFGQAATLAPVATIAAVFEEVGHGQADLGLVPIENSTDGRIVDTLWMFARQPLKICGEVQLRIHHNLLGRCSREDVKKVCSKPQALSQCRDWLALHMPDAEIAETSSTTAAAQAAARQQGVAAIASRQAGINYGLDLLAANIEDRKGNVTRFAIIGHQEAPRSGDDKTSLMLEISHQPGALADAMAIFKRNRLNLTWIESFPMPRKKNEYLFFVEMVGHPTDEPIQRAVAALRKKAPRVEILGAYRVTKPVD